MCDGPKVSVQKVRLSNKTHKCSECRGTIFYRELYTHFRGIWDEHWATIKTCSQCSEIRREIEKDLRWDQRPYLGELETDVVDKGDYDLLYRWVKNQQHRDVVVRPWVLKELDRLKKEKDDDDNTSLFPYPDKGCSSEEEQMIYIHQVEISKFSIPTL